MKTPPTKRLSPGFILGKSGAYAVLILGLVATLLPFFYIIVSSLKTDAELRQRYNHAVKNVSFDWDVFVGEDRKVVFERWLL